MSLGLCGRAAAEASAIRTSTCLPPPTSSTPTTLTDSRPASPPVYTVVMAPISGGGSGRFSSIPVAVLSSSAGLQHVPLGVLLRLLGWSVTVIMDEGEETARRRQLNPP